MTKSLSDNFRRYLASLKFWLSFSILNFRSRRGFTFLLGLLRLFGCIAILVSFDRGGADLPSTLWAWGIYLLIATLALVATYWYAAISDPLYYRILVFVDSLALLFFLYQRGDLHTEIYLLLLTPLVCSAHFFKRQSAILTTILVMLALGVVLYLIWVPVKSIALLDLLLLWLTRSLFLSLSTWLYRIQRNIPAFGEMDISSPSMAREHLEKLLQTLCASVPYDSASIQLLYGDRLVIVACVGFENRERVYDIEFPVNDPNFPNQRVISSGKSLVVDTKSYPVFKNPDYLVPSIRTWMGIPLLSPVTGELFGLISVDSKQEAAYGRRDRIRASWFALKAASYILESNLGPAALTMANKRETTLRSLELMTRELTSRVIKCQDDAEVTAQVVKIAQRVFNVEDCSLFLLRPKYTEYGESKTQVLHLVASSTIHPASFEQHESPVGDRPGIGVTGYAIFSNKTINIGFIDLKKFPYHGTFTGNLKYLSSGRSRQVMVVPIRAYNREPIGALKIENKRGWASEYRFPPSDQYLFENFTYSVGLVMEGIRERNYIQRQQTEVHNLRGIISGSIIKPLHLVGQIHDYEQFILNLKPTIESVTGEIDKILMDPGETLTLERKGLIPALLSYVSFLDKGYPSFKETCKRFSYRPTNVRDNLPFIVRNAFFNIGREALINAFCYSDVAHIENGEIRLAFDLVDGAYILRVEDNGRGFSLEQALQQENRFGIRQMFETIKKIQGIGKGAQLDIDSAEGQGTKIKVIWRPKE